jgi:hypothetical protein
MARKNEKSGGGNRKKGRNYRWDYTTHSVTKYRARHNIEGGISRKEAKAKRRAREA